MFAASILRPAPLGEARALGVVLLAALQEAVEARAPVLAGARAHERSQAHVDLDARDDVRRLEHVHEGLARRVVLEERLFVEDRAGDVLVDALCVVRHVHSLAATVRRRDDAVDATRRTKRWHAESRTGVVKRRLRHVWRIASVFSRPMDSRSLPTVPVDSSQAKRPLPGSTMSFAVWTSSSAYFSRLICGAAARGALRCCVENVFVGTSADAGALRARARMADFIVDLRCGCQQR